MSTRTRRESVARARTTARAPASLGGGYTRLGASYGLGRLSLLSALCGLAVHLSLVQRLGEEATRVVLVETVSLLSSHCWARVAAAMLRDSVTKAIVPSERQTVSSM